VRSLQRALQEFGHLNILVNNAARQILFPSIDQIPSEEWDYIFRTNIYAQFYLTKAAWPHLGPGRWKRITP
jgi:NAD(P)-dependent dehydrogenase (short-subunit alcohol dehydrogenase family)